MGKINFNTYNNSKRDVGSVLDKINSMTGKTKKEDERLFNYTRDTAGNAYVVLRFLPCVYEEQQTPVAFRFMHWFENNGKWLVEPCPTSPVFGKNNCPICEDNGRWFNENSKERQTKSKAECEDIGRPRSRKSEYYSNVYIVKDSQNPDNEGKVMIWKFNKTVDGMIKRAMKPNESDVKAGKKPIDVFDLNTGANFVLNIFTVQENGRKTPKYDNCTWQEPGPLFESVENTQKVYDSIYNLYEFIDPSKCKSYNQLEQKLAEVLGNKPVGNNSTNDSVPPPKEPETRKEPNITPKHDDNNPVDTSNDDLDDLFDDLD